MNTLFLLLALGAIILGVLDYLNGRALLSRLETEYPEQWKLLGSPTTGTANYTASRLALAKYIWTLSFLSMNDRRINLHCFATIAFQVALAVCFFVAFLGV
jgi:hypothetical protein